MNRAPLAQERVFDDEELARSYMERHRKMAAKLGRRYASKLIPSMSPSTSTWCT